MFQVKTQGQSMTRPLQRERVGRLMLLYQFDLTTGKLYLKLNEARGLQLASDAEAKGQRGRLAFVRLSVLPTSEGDMQAVGRVLFKPAEGKKMNAKSMRARTVLHRLHENLELNEEFELNLGPAMNEPDFNSANYRLHIVVVGVQPNCSLNGTNVLGCTSFGLVDMVRDAKPKTNSITFERTVEQMNDPQWFWLFSPGVGLRYNEPVKLIQSAVRQGGSAMSLMMRALPSPEPEHRRILDPTDGLELVKTPEPAPEQPKLVEITGRKPFFPNSGINDVFQWVPTKVYSDARVYCGTTNKLWLYHIGVRGIWAVGSTIGSLLPLAYVDGEPNEVPAVAEDDEFGFNADSLSVWQIYSGELDEKAVVIDHLDAVQGAYMPDVDVRCRPTDKLARNVIGSEDTVYQEEVEECRLLVETFAHTVRAHADPLAGIDDLMRQERNIEHPAFHSRTGMLMRRWKYSKWHVVRSNLWWVRRRPNDFARSVPDVLQRSRKKDLVEYMVNVVALPRRQRAMDKASAVTPATAVSIPKAHAPVPPSLWLHGKTEGRDQAFAQMRNGKDRRFDDGAFFVEQHPDGRAYILNVNFQSRPTRHLLTFSKGVLVTGNDELGGCTTVETLIEKLTHDHLPETWPVRLTRPIPPTAASSTIKAQAPKRIDLSDSSLWLHGETPGLAEAFELMKATDVTVGDGVFMVERHKDAVRHILNVNFQGKPYRHMVAANADGFLEVSGEQYGQSRTIHQLVDSFANGTLPDAWPVRLVRPVLTTSESTLTIVADRSKRVTEDVLFKLFQTLNSDSTNTVLSKEELGSTLNMRILNAALPKAVAMLDRDRNGAMTPDGIVAALDTNIDGVISVAEFVFGMKHLVHDPTKAVSGDMRQAVDNLELRLETQRLIFRVFDSIAWNDDSDGMFSKAELEDHVNVQQLVELLPDCLPMLDLNDETDVSAEEVVSVLATNQNESGEVTVKEFIRALKLCLLISGNVSASIHEQMRRHFEEEYNDYHEYPSGLLTRHWKYSKWHVVRCNLWRVTKTGFNDSLDSEFRTNPHIIRRRRMMDLVEHIVDVLARIKTAVKTDKRPTLEKRKLLLKKKQNMITRLNSSSTLTRMMLNASEPGANARASSLGLPSLEGSRRISKIETTQEEEAASAVMRIREKRLDAEKSKRVADRNSAYLEAEQARAEEERLATSNSPMKNRAKLTVSEDIESTAMGMPRDDATAAAAIAGDVSAATDGSDVTAKLNARRMSYANEEFTAWGELNLRSPSSVEVFAGFEVPGRQVHPLIGWDMPSAINAFINEDQRTLHRLGPKAWHDAADWLPKAWSVGASHRDVNSKADELCSVAHFALELTRAKAWRGLRRGLRSHLEIHAKRNWQENDSSRWRSVTSQNSSEFYQRPIPRNAALNGVYRQDDPLVMPELFELFRPRGRPEELYMAALRAIAILVKGYFVPRAKRVFVGAHNAGVSHVELKGHAVALSEMVAVNKYRHTPKPRPAAQSDLLTAVCVGEDPTACIKVARAIAHEFGGAAAITYLADLAEIEAAERFQLLPIMLSILVDTGTTVGELLANATGRVQTDLARFKDTPPPGVPGEQWWIDHNTVMAVLQGPASDMPCKLLVQVDVMTFASMQIRSDMHSLVRAYRCEACASLAVEFARPADASREHATDLVEAARNGWSGEVQRMLGHRVDVNGRQHGRMSPLYGAAECNRVNIILSLTRNKQCDVNFGHKTTGATPLYAAVENGHSGSIAALLAAGADVNMATVSGDGPVHVAVAKGLVDVAEQLVAHGADMNASNKLGMTPFHLVLASRSVDTGMLRLLLTTTADVNRYNLAGATPLQRIIQHPYESEGKKVMIAAALIDHGAGVNAANRRSQVSPLHYAAGLGMLEMVRLLLEQGADVYALGHYFGNHIHALQTAENVHRDYIAKTPADAKSMALEAMVSRLQQAAEAALARARLPASPKRPNHASPLPGYDDPNHKKVVPPGSKRADGRIKITIDKNTGVAPGQVGLSFVELPGKGQKITAVVEGAAAHATGKIAVKMVIMFVNGTSVKKVSKEECATLIRNSTRKVTLTLRPPKSKKNQQAAAPSPSPSPRGTRTSAY